MERWKGGLAVRGGGVLMAEEEFNYWITTYTGKKFPVKQPAVFDMNLIDIAHGLSLACRFGGQIREFYSVAQHSVLVASLLPAKIAVYGLLHDASEAYLCDIPGPIKRLPEMEGYRELEKRYMKTIYIARGMREPNQEISRRVKKADALVLRDEGRYFGILNREWDVYDMEDVGVLSRCWSPKEAEIIFMRTYEDARETLTGVGTL